jgi:hypothetical protein
MHSFPGALVGVALALVTIALVFGLVNMLRGGSANRSQMFMRWRVGLQAVAIAAILFALYIRRH